MSDGVVELRTRLFQYGGDRRFALLVDAIEDYAIYMIDPNGLISTWNTGAERLKGYTAVEVVGQHFSRFYTEEDQRLGEPARAMRIARETGAYKAEAWRVRKNGERFWADVLLDPITDEAGIFLGFAKITRDLTERRAAQEAIAVARETVVQAQRLESVGRLTGGVAHDFNNLLTVIRGNVELLQRASSRDASRREGYIAAIADAAERASSLTSQLLAFARRQALTPVALDCRIAVEALLDMSQSLAGPNIKVIVEVSNEQCPVMVDPGQFDTALLNLIVNARDAIINQGEIRVEVRNMHGPLNGDSTNIDKHVVVSVSDTGIGIAPENIVKIFEPFFTTKNEGSGTGLGLSQVYGFISQSGGCVAVESLLGHGTTVILKLPLSREVCQAIDKEPQAHESLANLGRVLIVDDNVAVGRLALEVITDMGCDAVHVSDAYEALAKLREASVPYDIVFSDIVMPGMNGLELRAEIQRRYPSILVLLTSGYSDILAKDPSGGINLLQKPYTARQLTTFLKGASTSPP